MYRAKLDSFNEIPKEKRPPRYMWDRPYELGQFLEHIWDTKDGKDTSTQFYEYDLEEVE